MALRYESEADLLQTAKITYIKVNDHELINFKDKCNYFFLAL